MEKKEKTKMAIAGKAVARLAVLNEKKKFILAVLDDADTDKFNRLMELYDEINAKLKDTETVKGQEEFIKFIENCDLINIELDSNYILERLVEVKEKIKKERDSLESETIESKIENAFKKGREFFENSNFDNEEELEENVRKENPLAYMTMQIIQHMSKEFIRELKKRGAKVNVPVTEDGKLLEGISVEYGEEGTLKEITLEQMLKTVAEFVPMVITAELHMDLKRSGRIKEFVKKQEEKNV